MGFDIEPLSRVERRLNDLEKRLSEAEVELVALVEQVNKNELQAGIEVTSKLAQSTFPKVDQIENEVNS